MYKHFLKRVLDILVSLVALPFVLLAVLIFGAAVWMEDKGPIFYNAPRLGKNGKVFSMYKIRSMRVNAPDIRNSDGSTFNGANDPRVTRIGRFLRKTSIDELPQFLNVLFGHMSLIGPRAHMANTVIPWDQLDEDRRTRLSVRPGITGYNQAYFRNGATAEEKIKNDVYYVQHLTFAMDVRVCLKTVQTVLSRKNVYVNRGTDSKEPASAMKETEK